MAPSSIGHLYFPRKIVLIVLTRSEFVDTGREEMHGELLVVVSFWFDQSRAERKVSVGVRIHKSYGLLMGADECYCTVSTLHQWCVINDFKFDRPRE